MLYLIVSGPTYAADDLLSVYQNALSHDPVYLGASYDYEAAREAIPQARSQLLPALQVNFRRNKTQQDIRERDNPFFGGVGRSHFWSTTRNVELVQPIFRFDAWVRLSQAKASVREAHATFAAAQQDLIRRTAEAYVIVLATQDNLQFLEAERIAVGKQLDLVKARRRGGLANITDEYEAQARSARVRADIIEAQSLLDDAIQGLRELVGDRVSNIQPMSQNLPMLKPDPLDPTEWTQRALRNNYSLLAANESVRQARQEVKARKAGHLPTLDFIARDSNADVGGALNGGASDVDTADLALELSIPLYSGGRIRSQTRQANKRYYRAIEDRRRQQRTVTRETNAIYQAIVSATSRDDALLESVQALESALKGRSRGYRSGVNTLLDVLDAERDLYATRRDLANNRYEYLTNLLRLKQQIGTLSEADLAEINNFLDSEIQADETADATPSGH